MVSRLLPSLLLFAALAALCSGTVGLADSVVSTRSVKPALHADRRSLLAFPPQPDRTFLIWNRCERTVPAAVRYVVPGGHATSECSATAPVDNSSIAAGTYCVESLYWLRPLDKGWIGSYTTSASSAWITLFDSGASSSNEVREPSCRTVNFTECYCGAQSCFTWSKVPVSRTTFLELSCPLGRDFYPKLFIGVVLALGLVVLVAGLARHGRGRGQLPGGNAPATVVCYYEQVPMVPVAAQPPSATAPAGSPMPNQV